MGLCDFWGCHLDYKNNIVKKLESEKSDSQRSTEAFPKGIVIFHLILQQIYQTPLKRTMTQKKENCFLQTSAKKHWGREDWW